MKNTVTISFVIITVALGVLLAFLFPQKEYDPDFARKEKIPGLDNFARIEPGIWRGAAPDEKGIGVLRKMGVKTVIDFRTNSSHEALLDNPDINYMQMPFSATDPPPREHVEKFVGILSDRNNHPVFFHCRYGKDRTGTMAAVYRIRVQGWAPEKAVAEMKYFGFRAIYRDLLKFVRSQTPGTAGK